MRRSYRRRASKPPVVTKSKRFNRGFASALRRARNGYNTRFIYDSFTLPQVSMSATADTIAHYNVRISDFPIAARLLSEYTNSVGIENYTEYKVVGLFAKLTPRNVNFIRNSTSFTLPDGYSPHCAMYPLTHFSTAPTGAQIPNSQRLRASNGVKWVSLRKGTATHLKLGAFFEERITVNDEGDALNLGTVYKTLVRMPWSEYQGEDLTKNPKFAPFAVWLPKASDANNLLNYSVEYRAVIALRNNKTDVTEM